MMLTAPNMSFCSMPSSASATLEWIGRAGLFDPPHEHVELPPAVDGDEAEIMRRPPLLDELLLGGVALLDRDVVVDLHHRGQPAVAGSADRGRRADHVPEIRVVTDVEPGIDARLDQQREVRAVVAG